MTGYQLHGMLTVYMYEYVCVHALGGCRLGGCTHTMASMWRSRTILGVSPHF